MDASLLAQIKGGKSLKKATTNDRSAVRAAGSLTPAKKSSSVNEERRAVNSLPRGSSGGFLAELQAAQRRKTSVGGGAQGRSSSFSSHARPSNGFKLPRSIPPTRSQSVSSVRPPAVGANSLSKRLSETKSARTPPPPPRRKLEVEKQPDKVSLSSSGSKSAVVSSRKSLKIPPPPPRRSNSINAASARTPPPPPRRSVSLSCKHSSTPPTRSIPQRSESGQFNKNPPPAAVQRNRHVSQHNQARYLQSPPKRPSNDSQSEECTPESPDKRYSSSMSFRNPPPPPPRKNSSCRSTSTNSESEVNGFQKTQSQYGLAPAKMGAPPLPKITINENQSRRQQPLPPTNRPGSSQSANVPSESTTPSRTAEPEHGRENRDEPNMVDTSHRAEIQSLGLAGLIEYMRAIGACTAENIFREPRTTERGRLALHEITNATTVGSLASGLENFDVHELALCLKLYFKEHRTPLPNEKYESIIQCCMNPNEDMKLISMRLQVQLQLLDSKYREDIRIVASFLNEVETQTASILAYTFGPTLFRPEKEKEDMMTVLKQAKVAARIAETLILCGTTIFEKIRTDIERSGLNSSCLAASEVHPMSGCLDTDQNPNFMMSPTTPYKFNLFV